jgi:hypothetical protein
MFVHSSRCKIHTVWSSLSLFSDLSYHPVNRKYWLLLCKFICMSTLLSEIPFVIQKNFSWPNNLKPNFHNKCITVLEKIEWGWDVWKMWKQFLSVAGLHDVALHQTWKDTWQMLHLLKLNQWVFQLSVFGEHLN